MTPTGRDERFRIFVGAFPHGPLVDRIQVLRERYDPKTAAITPPHVTLAGTYWRGGRDETVLIDRLKPIESRLAPFNLVLNGTGVFKQNPPVIYLRVELNEGLEAARRELLAVLGQDKHRVYSPHMTMAMRLRGPAADQMAGDLQRLQWIQQPIRFQIRELQLMQRGPEDLAWRCLARLSLAAGI